ncbi:hypothetical protein M404DRAFT_910607 [Pisolithus tinctorius Marx 270]|uniref:Uncharacterized protein n=1 Tax=Pisolithus tinctorius Marx 270 TaxID=870435 RepID=A0A0C3JMT7_PISTI|nr:hypothetical protein M404DRAFT_910607 [Pisolithus tinctorius Marx 270]
MRGSLEVLSGANVPGWDAPIRGATCTVSPGPQGRRVRFVALNRDVDTRPPYVSKMYLTYVSNKCVSSNRCDTPFPPAVDHLLPRLILYTMANKVARNYGTADFL